jgi:nucleoside 2-deoxyribosyltransferase
MKVYLCGPINGCNDNECKDWRAAATVQLTQAGHRAYDPMVRDYRGRELEPGIAAEIVENDKADIDACDAMLVYYPKPSVGTAMEVLYAWERKTRIVVIDESNAKLSPWLVYHSHAIFKTLDGAIRELLRPAVAREIIVPGHPLGDWR